MLSAMYSQIKKLPNLNSRVIIK